MTDLKRLIKKVEKKVFGSIQKVERKLPVPNIPDKYIRTSGCSLANIKNPTKTDVDMLEFASG